MKDASVKKPEIRKISNCLGLLDLSIIIQKYASIFVYLGYSMFRMRPQYSEAWCFMFIWPHRCTYRVSESVCVFFYA